MSSPIVAPSREQQDLRIKNVPAPTSARNSCHPASTKRRRVMYALSSTGWLASAVCCAATIQKYHSLNSRTSEPRTNDEYQRRYSLRNESHTSYPQALTALARLGRHMQEVVALHISRPKTLERIALQLSCHAQRLHLPRILNDPPPSIFLAACLCYAFVIAAFRHAHRKDQYQDLIIWQGVVLGLIGAWQSGNFVLESKSYLAWSVVLAMVFSSLGHRLLGFFAARDIQEFE